MLEILLILLSCRSIGRMLREKGRKPGLFQLAFVLLWFGGEIGGGVAAAVFQAMVGGGNAGAGMVYLCALLGAAIGAGIGFWIARSAAPADELATHAFPVIPVQPMEKRIG